MKPSEKRARAGGGAGGKKEFMTSLSGKRMVPKTHGRIVFRGLVDSLEAEVIEAQVLAAESGEAVFCAALGEVLDYLRAVMAAEVRETPLAPPELFGLDADELHRQSHSAGASPVFVLPSYTQGPIAARLNLLRAKIREAEIAAVRVFGPGEDRAEPGTETGGTEENPGGIAEREDIILGLNRLSSALWLLFRKYLSSREVQ